MRKFTDTKQREWQIVLDVSTVKRVRDLLQIDLMKSVEGEVVDRLATDPILLCDVLYVVCQPQAKSQGISDEDFGEGLAGKAIDDATLAFLQELVDFFPEARRKVLGKLLEKIRRVETLVSERALMELDSPALNEQIESLLTKSGPTSSDAPESWDATPSVSPTANSA